MKFRMTAQELDERKLLPVMNDRRDDYFYYEDVIDIIKEATDE